MNYQLNLSDDQLTSLKSSIESVLDGYGVNFQERLGSGAISRPQLYGLVLLVVLALSCSSKPKYQLGFGPITTIIRSSGNEGFSAPERLVKLAPSGYIDWLSTLWNAPRAVCRFVSSRNKFLAIRVNPDLVPKPSNLTPIGADAYSRFVSIPALAGIGIGIDTCHPTPSPLRDGPSPSHQYISRANVQDSESLGLYHNCTLALGLPLSSSTNLSGLLSLRSDKYETVLYASRTASSAFNLVLVNSASACASFLFSRMNVLPSKITSPAIPTTTRIGPRAWSSNFLSAQTSNGFAFLSSHLALRRANSFNFSQYSSTAPTVNTNADRTAANWLAARLFQSHGNWDDRKMAELAATVKIWLIVCALLLLPLGMLIYEAAKIICSGRNSSDISTGGAVMATDTVTPQVEVICEACESNDNVKVCRAEGCTAELCERCMKDHRQEHIW